jgi:hypothetical protein
MDDPATVTDGQLVEAYGAAKLARGKATAGDLVWIEPTRHVAEIADSLQDFMPIDRHAAAESNWGSIARRNARTRPVVRTRSVSPPILSSLLGKPQSYNQDQLTRQGMGYTISMDYRRSGL